MQNAPLPNDIIAAVSKLLSHDVLPALGGRLAYDVRVAVNALDLVARELALAQAAAAREEASLAALLGHSGALNHLNETLCAGIRDGSLDLVTPGLADHLWQTTLDTLAIEQPTYAAYRAEVGATDRSPELSRT
jgi:Domain of unknown function (DUF6285)